MIQLAKIIAHAFMDYGGYVVDDCAWDAYAITTSQEPAGNVLKEFKDTWGWIWNPAINYQCDSYADGTDSCNWVLDMAQIFTNMQVIDNNDDNNIGGGPTMILPIDAHPWLVNLACLVGVFCAHRPMS